MGPMNGTLWFEGGYLLVPLIGTLQLLGGCLMVPMIGSCGGYLVALERVS